MENERLRFLVVSSAEAERFVVSVRPRIRERLLHGADQYLSPKTSQSGDAPLHGQEIQRY